MSPSPEELANKEAFLEEFAALLDKYRVFLFPHGTTRYCVRRPGDKDDNVFIVFNRKAEKDTDARIENQRRSLHKAIEESEA